MREGPEIKQQMWPPLRLGGTQRGRNRRDQGHGKLGVPWRALPLGQRPLLWLLAQLSLLPL